MTFTTETRSGSHPVAAFLGWWKARRAESRRRRLLQQTRIELSELDDAILRDIGLTRGEIRAFDPDEHRRRWT